jgi:signal transduction histidine kinase/ActR/RegA family two-component response regulator
VAWPGEQLVTSEYGSNVKLMSLAVMLFGRGSNLAAQMRLMFRKMGQYYGATDVILAMIQPDFHSIYEEYEWHSGLSESRKERAVTYREAEWEELSACLETTSCLSWNEEKPLPETLAKFCRSEHAAGGYAVPLYDNGSVMGMLSIFNLSRRAPENGEERKELLETCGVIQGQLNQQRHDLASKAKSEFLSRMSHEIRTPMNGIIGMTAIALQHGQTPQKVHDCLSKIQMSSNYLLGLINDILDISKIESGKMQLAPEDFSMTELIDTVRELIRPQAERKSMSFELDIHMVHDWFVADKMRISQILINLLGNAVKFTEEHGTVVLTIREETQNGKQSEIFFSVRDNGVGIAQEDQERVFRAFEQASGYHSSGMKGTGLGLSISSRLIKLMGSKINLKSAPGEGSDFYFTLSVPLGECRNEDEKEEELSFEGRRILVVEDNELNAEIAQSILEECHFTVDCVHDGAQAVKRMEETAPGTYDLILMDIMMPVMDGLEATRTIRAMEREDCKTIPIIAMSANVFDDDLKKSVECGMNGHLSKPVEIDKMYKLLQKILK